MATAIKDAPVTVTAPRFPTIKPEHVKHDPSQYFRRVLIKLPKPVGDDETAIKPVDLHERPGELWSSVQKDRHAPLRRFDEVRIIAHDESWIINSALVTEADDKKVVFDVNPHPSKEEAHDLHTAIHHGHAAHAISA